MPFLTHLRRLQTILANFLFSVRFRMALWFTLVLAVILVVFSFFVYYRTAQDIRDQAAARLVLHMRDLNTLLIRSYLDYGNTSGWYFRSIPGSDTFTFHENEVLVLSGPDGNLAAEWGTISTDEAEQVASQGTALVKSERGTIFFRYPLTSAGGSTGVDYLFNPQAIKYDDHLLGIMILGQPLDPQGQLPRLVLTLFLSGGLTLLVAMAGAYWLASRALQPVQAITRTAQKIGETDLSRRLNLKSRDELGELAGTFDNMLDRLQAAFERQRQFTADASHELRTPLTIIGLEANRALGASRSAEDYRCALQVIQSENEFMSRLVGELLTLARMDAGQIALKQERVDLSDVALEVIERYALLASQKKIQLQAGDLPELPVLGDRTYLVQMIGNLVDNAIQYSPCRDGQRVQVETGAARENGLSTAWVRVTDNGPGIAPEHLPHLFERFYRVDRARSHETEEDGEGVIPGSGLGLSIVQWIAQMHGGGVTVQSEPGQGSCFEVRIPLLPFEPFEPAIFKK